jgi:Pyruvate/2-oxoacid:ferredoxin oxidoreductase delta subunit
MTVTDQDLGLLRATFVADEQGFLSQVVRGMELSRVVTTAVGPLLQRTLWKLLLDENWPEEDSRLHTFLGRLLDAQQMSPLPQYSERAPEVSDQRSLECSVCSQIVRDDAYVLATNHEPGCRKWHKKCFGCQFCAAGPDKQSLSTVQTDLESSTRLTCNGCDRYSVVKEMVNCELLVESIWVSWARARRQMEASKVPRLPELPFR